MSDEEGSYSSDGEKKINISKSLYDIRTFLRQLPGHPFVSFEDVNDQLSINLHIEPELLERLGENEMIQVEASRIKFKPRFNIVDIPSLIEALNKHPTGIAIEEIVDCGPEDIRDDVYEAIHGGLCISIKCKAQGGPAGGNTLVLFPPGDSFLCALDGQFTGDKSKPYKLTPTEDVTAQVRPGDAILVGDHGLLALRDGRSDSYLQRVTNGDGSMDQMERISKNIVPYSRSNTPRPAEKSKLLSTLDYSSNVFVEPGIFVDTQGCTVYKHGCHNDIREVWNKVCSKFSFTVNRSDELDQELLANNLIKKEWLDEAVLSSDYKPRPKIKRPRQNNRIRKRTNDHLD